jgi:hypothetical protein
VPESGNEIHRHSGRDQRFQTTMTDRNAVTGEAEKLKEQSGQVWLLRTFPVARSLLF